MCGSFQWKNDYSQTSFTANGTCADDIGMYTVNFWVEDECGRVSNMIELDYIIEDTTDPDLTAPANLTLNCGDDAITSIINNWLMQYNASDLCSDLTVVNNFTTLT